MGASVTSIISSEIISVGGILLATEMGYIIAMALFTVMMFTQPGASSINGDDDGTSHPPHAPSAIGAPGVDFHGLHARV